MKFQKYVEQQDAKLEEGLGSWVGQKMGQGVDLAAKGLGRAAHAAGSAVGTGTMAGMKRGASVMMHGNGKNQIHQMANQAQKAVMSGDPDQFKQIATQILKQMRQAQPQAQPPQQPQIQPPPGWQDPQSGWRVTPQSGAA